MTSHLNTEIKLRIINKPFLMNQLPKIILIKKIWFLTSLKKVNNKQLATCKTLYLVFSGNYVKLSDLFFTFFSHSFVAHNKNRKYQKVWFKIPVTMNSKMHFIHMESSHPDINVKVSNIRTDSFCQALDPILFHKPKVQFRIYY